MFCNYPEVTIRQIAESKRCPSKENPTQLAVTPASPGQCGLSLGRFAFQYFHIHNTMMQSDGLHAWGSNQHGRCFIDTLKALNVPQCKPVIPNPQPAFPAEPRSVSKGRRSKIKERPLQFFAMAISKILSKSVLAWHRPARIIGQEASRSMKTSFWITLGNLPSSDRIRCKVSSSCSSAATQCQAKGKGEATRRCNFEKKHPGFFVAKTVRSVCSIPCSCKILPFFGVDFLPCVWK